MKHTKKRLLSIFAAAALTISSLPQGTPLLLRPALTASAADTSGTCGENLTWTLDSEGTLTISGTGDMEDYYHDNMPWTSLRGDIKSAVIEKGVTSIGESAFNNCKDLTIKGYTGSAAECYAKKNGFVFVSIGSAEQEPTGGSFGDNATWSFDASSGTLTISGTGAVSASSSKAYPWCKLWNQVSSLVVEEGITEIGREAFFEFSHLTSVSVPKSLTKIGSYAFRFCYKLTDLSLSEGLETIGTGAFDACSSLSGVDIPKSVTTIEYGAFQGCTALKKVSISANLTKIGNAVFSLCGMENIPVEDDNPNYCDVDGVLFTKDQKTLMQYPSGRTDTAYVIPKGVTAVGGYAFADSKFTELTIPETVQSFGGFAFYNSAWLAEKQKSEQYIVVNGILIAVGEKCTGDVTIPADVKTVGEYAFFRNSDITSAVVPETVTAVLGSAFAECENLTNVTFLNPECDIESYSNTVPSTATVSGLTGSTAEHYTELFGHTFISIGVWEGAATTAPAAVTNPVYTAVTAKVYTAPVYTAVTAKAVTAAPVLTTAKVVTAAPVTTTAPKPETAVLFTATTAKATTVTTVTTVPAHSAMGGTLGKNLQWRLDSAGTLTISGTGEMPAMSVMDIPWYASRKEIKKIVINEGVTTIADYAFCESEKLESVTIPNSITKIGDSAFSACVSLAEIKIPDSVTEIGNSAFRSCQSLTEVTIPDSVTTLGYEAFQLCEKLKSVKLPNRLTELKISVFSSTALTEIELPETLQLIAENAFKGCKLTSISIPQSVTSIGIGAFSGNPLTEVTVPENVEYIKNEAFNCSALTDITILNANCAIYKDKSVIGSKAVIHGYAGSTAEEYAKEYGRTFEEISGAAGDNDSFESEVTEDGKAVKITGYKGEGGAVVIPKAIGDLPVTEIGNMAFFDNQKLTGITIPDSVMVIGDSAFSGCAGLSAVTLPDSITKIGAGAFSGCPDLTISGNAGSFAEQYASENNIPFRQPGQSADSADFNKDGSVTVADAVLLARFISEDKSLTDSQLDGLRNAEPDQNDDGLLTVLDVKAILKKLTIV